MGFHGRLSHGCDRCRRRKVKCDEERPECLKCRTNGHVCPGYRDLEQLVFRNENARILKRAHKHRTKSSSASSEDNAGSQFFFANFSFPEPPPFGRQKDWLKQLAAEDESIPIEQGFKAVGLAALANVKSDGAMAKRAAWLRNDLANAVQEAMRDQNKETSDSVLMGLLLLTLYENMTVRSWSEFGTRSIFTNPAIDILKRRGAGQFVRPASTLLYVQTRHEALLGCGLSKTPVPPAIVQIACDFSAAGGSQRWRTFAEKSPGSIGEIAFRVVNLNAALATNPGVAERRNIREKILSVEEDLAMWTECLSKAWEFRTVKAAPNGHGYDGEQHVYANLWIVEIWNCWRVLQILASEAFEGNEQSLPSIDQARVDRARVAVRECSKGICLSVASLFETTRCTVLVQCLSLVARAALNHRRMREFAITKLRELYRSKGIGQALLLADDALASLQEIASEEVLNI